MLHIDKAPNYRRANRDRTRGSCSSSCIGRQSLLCASSTASACRRATLAAQKSRHSFFFQKMNSDAAFKQIESLLNDHDLNHFMLYDTPNPVNTRKETTINTKKKASYEDTYHLMIWWRHFSHVQSIQWIITTDERRIEHQARKQGIQKCNHKQLQKKFGSYDNSSDSSDDGDYQTTAQCTALSPISFEKSLIFNLSSLKQETVLKPRAATDKRKFDEVYSSSSSSD